MTKKEAFVFDVDGLMIDSEPLARQAWDRVLLDYGLQMDSQTFSRMIGLRLEESSQLVKDVFSLKVTPERLAEKEQACMSKIMAQGIPCMPGLGRLIDEINRRHLPWGVATSSKRSYAYQVLEQIELLDSCQAVAAGDEVEKGKPAPDIYLLAARRLNMEPSACIALEDSVPGVEAAAAAGMTIIAVPNGETSTMDFGQADFVYDSLTDVASDIDKLLVS